MNPGAQNHVGQFILGRAQTQLGKPYKFGGNLPPFGNDRFTDCSGLVQWAAWYANVHLARSTYEQYLQGTSVFAPLLPGDRLYFRGSDPGLHGEPGHVGLYVSPGKMLNDPRTRLTVSYASFAMHDVIVAKRDTHVTIGNYTFVPTVVTIAGTPGIDRHVWFGIPDPATLGHIQRQGGVISDIHHGPGLYVRGVAI